MQKVRGSLKRAKYSVSMRNNRKRNVYAKHINACYLSEYFADQKIAPGGLD